MPYFYLILFQKSNIMSQFSQFDKIASEVCKLLDRSSIPPEEKIEAQKKNRLLLLFPLKIAFFLWFIYLCASLDP